MTDRSSSRDAGDRGESSVDGKRDGGASGLSRCPQCDRPVAVLTICGPMDARVGPCGCRLSVVDVNELTGSSSS